MSHSKNQSGISSSIQGIHSEKQSQLFENIALASVPYHLDIDNDLNNQSLVDAQYCILSNIQGQLEVFQVLADSLPAKEEIQIQAGSLSAFAETIARQVATMEVVTDGLSSVISQLKRDHEKQCEAYELQLSVLRDTCETLRGDRS